jgi:hypothetical protein
MGNAEMFATLRSSAQNLSWLWTYKLVQRGTSQILVPCRQYFYRASGDGAPATKDKKTTLRFSDGDQLSDG